MKAAAPVSVSHSRNTGWYWVAGSVVLVTLAQLAFKLGGGSSPLANCLAGKIDPTALAAIGFGLGCYAVSMLCWLRALESLPLNVSYPLLSVSYPLVYFGAIALPQLHETLSLWRLAGVALVMAGVVLLVPENPVPENRARRSVDRS